MTSNPFEDLSKAWTIEPATPVQPTLSELLDISPIMLEVSVAWNEEKLANLKLPADQAAAQALFLNALWGN